ncbi:MAG TPA: 3-deoxy-manno-octulosonate cytidylyltransferase, partial [Usitatibacter sp.]|nr:3-deoxy-manno-octulosonate cytidylyltransferase [Usitatibacter sp.]
YARDAFAISRETLPPGLPAYRHIGIYGYRVGFLRAYSSLTATLAERFEALEQLRALGHGHRIAVALWQAALEPGVDTQSDLDRVRARLAR